MTDHSVRNKRELVKSSPYPEYGWRMSTDEPILPLTFEMGVVSCGLEICW